MHKFLCIIFFVLSLTFLQSSCLHFLLSEGREKCIFDDIPEEEDVKLEYQLYDPVQVSAGAPMLEITIFDPEKIIMKTVQVYDTDKKTYGFIPQTNGRYTICFKVPRKHWVGGQHQQVRFDMKMIVGEAEEDIDSLASAGDFALLKEKAKKLDNKCQNYIKVQDMNRATEDKLYEENEKIDERVIFATIFQIVVILASGIFQILSLRKFFIKIHMF